MAESESDKGGQRRRSLKTPNARKFERVARGTSPKRPSQPRAEPPPVQRKKRLSPPRALPPLTELNLQVDAAAPIPLPSPFPPAQADPAAEAQKSMERQAVERGMPLPSSYGLDRLVALVRDPAWLLCYWELTGPKLSDLLAQRGDRFVAECAWALRLNRLDANVADDFEIDAAAGNWYINVGLPGRYQLELALLSPEGEWIALAVSQIVETPPFEPSTKVDAQWRVRSEDESTLAAFLRRKLLVSSGTHAASRLEGASAQQPNFLGASRFGSSSSADGSSSASIETLRSSGVSFQRQANLPAGTLGRTLQAHFRIRLPRQLANVPPARPTWPPEK